MQKCVSGTIAVSGFSCFWSYHGLRLYASMVLLGSSSNCGNGTERVKYTHNIIFIVYIFIEYLKIELSFEILTSGYNNAENNTVENTIG